MHLKGLELKELTLPSQAQTDLGLKHYVAAVTTPTKLRLSRWSIGGASLAHLAGLTNLKELDLSYSWINDAGLVHLKGLTNLEQLNLYLSRITDAGLVHLKGMSQLKYLDLRGNHRVTVAGLYELKKTLLECKISY